MNEPEILVTDDSSLIRSELREAFLEENINTMTATNGAEALQILSEYPSIKLMISDLNMPNMTGLELVQKIRNEQKNTELNVIIISTETNSTMRHQCKELQISGWALKPLSIDSMLPVVKRLIAPTKN